MRNKVGILTIMNIRLICEINLINFLGKRSGILTGFSRDVKGICLALGFWLNNKGGEREEDEYIRFLSAQCTRVDTK